MTKAAPTDAALDFVLGGLTGPERQRLAAARATDAALDQEIAALEFTFQGLALAVTDEIAPGADVLDRIEAALDVEELGLKGVPIELLGEGSWSDVHPGIAMKPLWDGRSFLFRCAAGATIPSHPHGAEERFLVIAGDVVVGGESFGPGDTMVHGVGRLHAPTTTRTGCLILLQYVN